MISASQAQTASNGITGSLAYINSLITGATDEGAYTVFVDGKLMNDDMADILVKTYDYRVTKNLNDFGTYPTYKISWVPLPETPGMSGLFLSTDVNGGARWFYAVMDFKKGRIVGLVDTGLNVSDYGIYNTYPLQGKGFAAVLGGPDLQVFLLNSEGTLIEQYTASTNYNYDVLDGIWFYHKDSANRFVKAFNGKTVYYLEYGSNQDFYIDWDWDGATNTGAFQYTLFDGDNSTDSIRLVKADGTMTELALLNLSESFHDCFVYWDKIFLLTYNSNTSAYQQIRVYNDAGSLLETINLASDTYYDYDFSAFGEGNINILFYNNNDYYQDYGIITYLANGTVINETHARGDNYPNWNQRYDSLGMYTNDYKSNSFYNFFFSGWGWENNMFSVSYCDVYYIQNGNTTSNLEVLQNSGNPDKYIGIWSSMSNNRLIVPIVDTMTDAILRFNLIDSAGNNLINTGIYYGDLLDWGWSDIFGDYFAYRIYTYNGSYNDATIYLIKNDNSDTQVQVFNGSSNIDRYSYYNLYILYVGANDTFYYFNTTSNGFQVLYSGVSCYIYDQNRFYNSDNTMKSNVLIHNQNLNTCKVLNSTSISNEITLPATSGSYDLEVMSDYFVYLYNDASTYFLTAKAYDLNGTELNSYITNTTWWAEGINSADNRYWFSHYIPNQNNMLRYHLFDDKHHDTVDMSNYNTSYHTFDDIVWWD